MIDFELKELLRKAYKAGRRNALKQDELNFNDFINKHEGKLKLFAIPVVMQQRELLIAFAKNSDPYNDLFYDYELAADSFLEDSN